MATSGVSRRDFLRLRRTERGRVAEVSCHALFMRCADAGLEPPDADAWEPWMGEPPLVVARLSVDEVLASLERDLHDAQVLRLHEAQWLESMDGAATMRDIVDRFVARGGAVERL